MTTHTRFAAIGTYLPPTAVSTPELVARMSYTPPFDLEKITGIGSRRVHGPDEDSLTMAVRAARECLSRSPYAADEIEVVISASITRFTGPTRFRMEPSFAHAVAGAIGATTAIHFDVSNACAGMMTGVAILDRMIKAGMVRNGLVVSGEQATAVAETGVKEIADKRDLQFGSLTVGDSAAAVIVDESPSPDDRIHYIELMTSAEFADLCIGKPSDRNPGIALYTDNATMHKEDRAELWTKFQSDFLAAHGSGFAAENYDYIVHHQVGSNFIRNFNTYGEKLLGTAMPESLSVLDHTGNTATTSHFMVLSEHLSEGKGGKYLFVPAASGVVTGCVSATIPADRGVVAKPPVHERAQTGGYRIKATGVSLDPATGGSIAHATAAAAQCLADAGVTAAQVDLVINAGVYRDENMFEPAMAALIQKDLGICLDYAKDPDSHGAFSFDLMNGASGGLGAIQAAGAWLTSGTADYALVVTSDVHPAGPGHDFPYAPVGAAVLLERTSGAGFGPVQTSVVETGRTPGVTGYFDLAEAGAHGREHIVVEQEPGHVERLIAFAAAEAARYAETHDVDLGRTLLVTSQPTAGFAAAVAKELGLAADAAVTVTGVDGDPHTSALAIAWHQAAGHPFEQALFVAVGAGPTATCVLYRQEA